MNLKSLQPYTTYLIICGLFLITIIACVFIYIEYISDLDAIQDENDGTSIEVTLPVIEWGKYESLSKKYTNGIILK